MWLACYILFTQHYYYLSVLVDTGWSTDQNQNLPARPLPLLVEQGRATLAQLETEEVHMSQCCEEMWVPLCLNKVKPFTDKISVKNPVCQHSKEYLLFVSVFLIFDRFFKENHKKMHWIQKIFSSVTNGAFTLKLTVYCSKILI